MALRPGDPAPDFTLLTDAGTTLTLSSLLGRTVVLYFYPKDDTETCTVEACGFRDRFPRFKRRKAVILGVSPDAVKSHQRFKRKYELPFTLLADTDRAVAGLYGVWQEKSMWGRTFMGVVRTTFLIAPDGRIAHVFDKVSAASHADDVARVLADVTRASR